MLSPYVLLVNARNRITKRENWNTGTLARSKYTSVRPDTAEACQWCAIGAIAAEAGVKNGHALEQFPEGREAVKALARAIDPDEKVTWSPRETVFQFNDYTGTHEEVLAAFDIAIDNMKGR